jgi:hypothetical protein
VGGWRLFGAAAGPPDAAHPAPLKLPLLRVSSERCGTADGHYCVRPGASGQVEGGRDGHREGDQGIAVIGLQNEDEDGDQAGEHGDDPSNAGEIHGPILAARGDGALSARWDGPRFPGRIRVRCGPNLAPVRAESGPGAGRIWSGCGPNLGPVQVAFAVPCAPRWPVGRSVATAWVRLGRYGVRHGVRAADRLRNFR